MCSNSSRSATGGMSYLNVSSTLRDCRMLGGNNQVDIVPVALGANAERDRETERQREKAVGLVSTQARRPGMRLR